MAIELPSKPDVLDVLDERLALLEDPSLAEQLIRENPALFTAEPPQTQREILAWTTRRFGTALLAVTAAVALAAGYLGSEFARGHAAAPSAAPHPAAAAVILPLRHATLRHASATPSRHAATHPAVLAAPHAIAAVHVLALPVPHPRAIAHHALAPVAHAIRVALPQAAPAAGSQSAAAQLAAWEAAHPAARAHASTSGATASEPATVNAQATEPATTTSAPVGTTEAPTQAGPPKTPTTSPGGVWTERIPGGGTFGGGFPQSPGVPRDSCTPRGGRTGIVMEAISVLMSSRH